MPTLPHRYRYSKYPASKDGRGDTDTLKAKHNSAPLGQPKVDAGAAKRALEQLRFLHP